MGAAAVPEWRIRGDGVELCSCAIGSPCVFGSDPTHGLCDGARSWLLRDGHYGGVALGGHLGVVAVVPFEGNGLDRNRALGRPIDDPATAAPREALATWGRPLAAEA